MFIPLHDNNPLVHVTRPYVNWTLIALTCLTYALFQATTSVDGQMALPASYGVIPVILFDHAVLPAEFAHIPADLTLITYAFFHGSWMHLLGNMVFLWVFGDNVEDALGHIKYLLFYVLCAAGGGYLHAVFNAHSEAPLIGASGAVAGIVAAYLLLHPRVKIWILALGRIPLRLSAQWVLGVWVLMQIYNLFAASEGQVAWWAHIGGLISGAGLVLILRRRGVSLFDRDLKT